MYLCLCCISQLLTFYIFDCVAFKGNERSFLIQHKDHAKVIPNYNTIPIPIRGRIKNAYKVKAVTYAGDYANFVGIPKNVIDTANKRMVILAKETGKPKYVWAPLQRNVSVESCFQGKEQVLIYVENGYENLSSLRVGGDHFVFLLDLGDFQQNRVRVTG
jgi:hypothetical protein